MKLLEQATDNPLRMTLLGPFTMAQQAQNRAGRSEGEPEFVNDYYADDGDLAMAFAAAVNAEVLDLVEAGVDIVSWPSAFGRDWNTFPPIGRRGEENALDTLVRATRHAA